MTQLSDYLLGQTLHKLQSIESAQEEHSEKIETLTEKVDEALTWAQRIIWLGLSILGTAALNWSPDKIGEALAAALKAIK
jgi:hypothetical protein